jgi:hypothetical protein
MCPASACAVTGILVAHEDFAAPAVAWVASQQPHFMCFFDRGSRIEGPEVLDGTAPELYHITNHVGSHHSSFLVLAKGTHVTGS